MTEQQRFLLDNLIFVSPSLRRNVIAILLRRINIEPGLILSAGDHVNEAPLKMELPRSYSIRVAETNGKEIQNLNQDSFILSINNIIACGRRILLRAENIEQAEKYIRLLSGRRHRIYTTICLLTPFNKQHIRTVITVVKFKRLSEKEIRYYLASGDWKNSTTGGYNAQGLAGMFILFARGSYHPGIGLPLYEIYRLLSNYYNLTRFL